MDRLAQALADPIRRKILLMLRTEPQTAGTIADVFPVSRPAISRHLRVLREAALVSDETRGRQRRYRLELSALDELVAYLRQLQAPVSLWQQRFDALATEVHRVRRTKRLQSATVQRKRAPQPKTKRKKVG